MPQKIMYSVFCLILFSKKGLFDLIDSNKQEGPWALGRSPEIDLYNGVGKHSSSKRLVVSE